jgi:hypothetical protein
MTLRERLQQTGVRLQLYYSFHSASRTDFEMALLGVPRSVRILPARERLFPLHGISFRKER